MTITNEEIEKKLAEQLPTVQLPCPSIDLLEQRAATRRRSRSFRRGAAVLFAFSALGMVASRWLVPVTTKDLSMDVADVSALEAQTNRTLERIDDLQRAMSSLPLSSAAATDDDAPFRVFAKWRIPVVVKSNRPENKALEGLNVLEITKKLDPRTLSFDELRAVEKLLPDQQSTWNQL